MKQSLSPTVVIVIAVLVVVVIGAVGYFAFLKPKTSEVSEETVPQEEGMAAMEEAFQAAPAPGSAPGR